MFTALFVVHLYIVHVCRYCSGYKASSSLQLSGHLEVQS